MTRFPAETAFFGEEVDFFEKDGCLNCVEAAVNTHQGVLVFGFLAVNADLAHFVGQGVVVCEDGAAVAVAAQGFGREEGGAADGGKAAGFLAMMGGTERNGVGDVACFTSLRL